MSHYLSSYSAMLRGKKQRRQHAKRVLENKVNCCCVTAVIILQLSILPSWLTAKIGLSFMVMLLILDILQTNPSHYESDTLVKW
jgi:hypothetical protein